MFAADVLAQRTDDALQTFDEALADLDRAARRARDEHQRRAGRTTDDAVRRFVQLGRLLLEAREHGRDPLRLVEQLIGLERLRGELELAERLTRSGGDPYLEQLASASSRSLGCSLRCCRPCSFMPAPGNARCSTRSPCCAAWTRAAAASRAPELTRTLYAVLVSQATNVGLTRMAEISDLSYDQLASASEWYLRKDTLRAAIVRLVDFHHALPLAQALGSGQLSSSDGQRFPTRSHAPGSTPLPRSFGHRRWGVQRLTWTSDQCSQYGTKVVPASVGDATHVLDEILDNETTLQIERAHHRHPRLLRARLRPLRPARPQIRAAAARPARAAALPPRAGGAARQPGRRAAAPPPAAGADRAALGRVAALAASLKHGWTSASDALTRLHANAGSAPLARALQEHGRLVKTNFALAWFEDQELRGRVGRQLNKGEALHALRRYVLFAREGRLRHRDPDDRADQALSLNLVVDAIVAWNTVYAQDALDHLAREEHRHHQRRHRAAHATATRPHQPRTHATTSLNPAAGRPAPAPPPSVSDAQPAQPRLTRNDHNRAAATARPSSIARPNRDRCRPDRGALRRRQHVDRVLLAMWRHWQPMTERPVNSCPILRPGVATRHDFRADRVW